MSSKRNHHLQPNFYLKGFKSSDEGNPKVWVYEKGKPFYDGKTEQLQNPRHLTTEKVARKKDFYAFVKEDGSKEYEKYEDLLMKEFEQPADSVIEKVRCFEDIDDEQKSIMSFYVASMIMRSEWGKGMTNLSFDLAIEEQKLKNSKLSQTVADSYEKWVQHVKFRDELSKESIVIRSSQIASVLEKMKWTFYFSKRLKYLTSDNPISFSKIKEKEGYLLFPISSKVALYSSWQQGKDLIYAEANDGLVESFREEIVKIAIKKVYYSQKAEWLVKFINKFT